MLTLYWLDQIQSSEYPHVGEKAFTLSQLKQSNYPVLPGFAIGTASFRNFLDLLDSSDSLLADFPNSSLYLDIDNPRALQLVAQQSRQAILEAVLPSQWGSTLLTAAQQLQSPTLILRSSLVLPSLMPQAFAGLLPARVCWCDQVALELALKQAWVALFSAKSLFYWQRVGIKLEQIQLAILVQPISNADSSGLAKLEGNAIEIQATWGLGHSLLQGEVLPDTFKIELATGKITYQQLGYKTRAYRLKSESESLSIPQNCLEAYLLTQEEQERFALSETALTQLLQLAGHLAKEHKERGFLEWTLTQATDNQMAQLYLTQFCPSSVEETISKPSLAIPIMAESPLLLTGLSASPGVVRASVQVITDLSVPEAMLGVGRIIVARQMPLDWLALLKDAVGVIVEQGGITSHAAILARELGIPALVGATGATQLLKTGEFVLLDSDKGTIYRLQEQQKSTDIIDSFAVEANSQSLEQAVSDTDNWAAQLPPLHNPIGTKLMVNLSQPSSIAQVAALPIDGVGLLRSELMVLELFSQKPLEEWLQESQKTGLVEQLTQLIREFARGFAPRVVCYRSIDWRAFEVSQFSVTDQLNLSLRGGGTYHYLKEPMLFDLELEALAQVRAFGYTNVNLILPFVRSIEEFSFCRRRVERVGLTEQASFQLWMMAEVPSVLFLLPQYVQAGVQGISIGTNDLTQLLLGIDREQSHGASVLNASHPAMLAAIKQLINLCRTAGIPCSICGQAPVQAPQLIEQLVRWGITSISVEPEAIVKTYRAIARAEQLLLLEAARDRLKDEL